MTGLLWRRFTLRHWRQAPLQSAVLILILALGIGVFFAMRLANRAVLASFESFTELIKQESDWVLTSPAGSLPESTLREVRALLGDRPVELLPVLEITAAEPPRGEDEREFGTRRTWSIVGVDLAALTNLAVPRESAPEQHNWLMGAQGEFWDVLKRERAAYLTQALAEQQRLGLGGKLGVLINDRLETLEVAGIIPRAAGGGEAPVALIVMDLPVVQKLAGTPGRIERIECVVEEGASAPRLREEARAILTANAHGRWTISSRNERRETASQLTHALRLNLTLLSSLALLVGFYFIHQALDGAVVRRREEIATLRSLGVTEREIRGAWLLEAAALGLAGGALGGLLGWLGAQLTVKLVSRSVNALYHASHVEHAPFVLGEFALSLLLGLAFSLLAGWFPARDAARTPPAQILRRHAQTALARLRWWPGVALAVVAVLAVLAPPFRWGDSAMPLGGYVATLAIVFSAAAFMGLSLAGLARALRKWSTDSAPLRVALSQLRRPTVRHVIAAACLLSAVAMTGGMAVLVGSYDHTMRAWLNRTFLADLYISSEGAQSASSTNRLRPETWQPIAHDPDVEDFYAVQMSPIEIAGRTTLLAGADLGFLARRVNMSWLHAPPPEFYESARNEHLAVVSEAFLPRYRVKVGDEIAFPTPAGEQRVRIAGVFADYGNERGTLLIDRQHYARWWGHELITTLTLKLRPLIDPGATRARLRQAHPELSIFTNRTLREQAIRIFQETFAITYALEIIGVAVAVTGLGLTLASIFLQRRGDLATLRALGWTPGEIARAAAIEGLLLSIVGLVAGLALSLILGALLVFVINKQTFGWTLEYHLPWSALTLLSALVLASGAATSFLIGRWAARLPGDREE
jgi:putative ABC transport system permease protein